MKQRFGRPSRRRHAFWRQGGRELAVRRTAPARTRTETVLREADLIRLMRIVEKVRAKAFYRKAVAEHARRAERVRRLMAAVMEMNGVGTRQRT